MKLAETTKDPIKRETCLTRGEKSFKKFILLSSESGEVYFVCVHGFCRRHVPKGDNTSNLFVDLLGSHLSVRRERRERRESGERLLYFYIAKIYALRMMRAGQDAPKGKIHYQKVRKFFNLAAENGYNVFVGIYENPAMLAFLKKNPAILMGPLTGRGAPSNTTLPPDPFHPKVEIFVRVEDPKNFIEKQAREKRFFEEIETTFQNFKKIVYSPIAGQR